MKDTTKLYLTTVKDFLPIIIAARAKAMKKLNDEQRLILEKCKSATSYDELQETFKSTRNQSHAISNHDETIDFLNACKPDMPISLSKSEYMQYIYGRDPIEWC